MKDKPPGGPRCAETRPTVCLRSAIFNVKSEMAALGWAFDADAAMEIVEVLTEVRRVGAGAAIADDEHGLAGAIAIEDGVGESLDLGRVDPRELLGDALEELAGIKSDT